MEQRRFPIFAERFSQLRAERTQKEFADFLDISRPTVGFYENGSRIPDALVLRQIAEKCNVSVNWLLGLSDANSNNSDIQSVCKFTGLTEAAIKKILSFYETERILDNDNVMNMAQVLSRIIEEPCFTPMLEDLQMFFNALYHVSLRDKTCGKPCWYCSDQAQKVAEELSKEVGKYVHVLTDYQVVTFYKSSVKGFWEQLLEEMEETYRKSIKEESENGKLQASD